jgi:hypothetical protein
MACLVQRDVAIAICIAACCVRMLAQCLAFVQRDVAIAICIAACCVLLGLPVGSLIRRVLCDALLISSWHSDRIFDLASACIPLLISS